MPRTIETVCPCDSGEALVSCCGALIAGRARAETALQLMRSRYVAYVLGDAAWLRASWHPDSCPAEIVFDQNIRWLGLKILAIHAGGANDQRGKVEFVARYKIGGRAFRLHENSRFVRLQDNWVYVEGETGK